MNMEQYTIGQFSKLAGVNKETVRYYESLGLLPQPQKNKSGYKVYTKQHVELMEIILIVKEAGFSLKEIQEFINIQDANKDIQNDFYKETILNKIALIEKKMSDLDTLKRGLEKVVYDIEHYNIRRCIEMKKKGEKCID